MSFGDAVRSGFDNYVTFDGRASRPAFWWWVLFQVIVLAVAYIISQGIFDSLILYYLAALALFLPSLAIQWRRLHDTGRSGWWWLIGFVPFIGWIVLLIFYLQQSDEGANEYGPPMAAAPVA